jgi:predicted nucleotidyltransferase
MNRALTIEEIKTKVTPLAEKYRFPAIYLFGSYARGEASEKSDIDIIVDLAGTSVKSAFQLGGVFNDFEAVFGEDNVDLVTFNSISNPRNSKPSLRFAERVNREKVKIYERT